MNFACALLFTPHLARSDVHNQISFRQSPLGPSMAQSWQPALCRYAPSAGGVANLKALCHFLLDTKTKTGQFDCVKKPYESHEDEYRRMAVTGAKSWFQRNRPWDIDPHDEHFLEDVFVQPWAPKNGNAIELGCGTGPLTRWLAKSGFKTTGVDVSKTAVRMAREQSKTFTIDYRVADICTKNVRSFGKFDLCMDGRFFHGITNLKDRSAVLENVSHLLKPNGIFILMSMCAPIERGSLAQQYPDQKILQNVIYYPLKKANAFSGARTINGQQYLPTRFLGHWKYLLSELQKAGLRPLLVRFNHCLPQEPVSSLNVAAVKTRG
jgi:2-polyprenyl-3-methyl-5-hydroxy-6-metoxy-1,4-benzoquinol methylase